MGRRAVSGILLSLLLASVLTFAFNIQPVEASRTIYILLDGRVSPFTAPIKREKSRLYVFTDNISATIRFYMDNIVIDGTGYTLQDPAGDHTKGIDLTQRKNVALRNMSIKGFYYGIYLQPVSTSGTIYIRPDGTVDGTDKIQRDGDIYTFTDNIYDKIVVEKDNIVVDGAGFTLQGTGAYPSKGIALTERSNVTIKNIEIAAFYYGIRLRRSSNNTISGNNITNNGIGISIYDFSDYNSVSGNDVTNNREGIILSDSVFNSVCGNNIANNWEGIFTSRSSDNTISRNNVTNNSYDGIHQVGSSSNVISRNNITENGDYGIHLDASSSNTISENSITSNGGGIWLLCASNNKFYHNDFVENTKQVYDLSYDEPLPPSINMWDNGYPSGGNYWSDHVTVDDYCGVNQDELGSDGIVDEPYIIDDSNRDNYPLVEPWSPLPRTIGELKTEIEKCWSEGEIDNQGIVNSLLAKLNVAQKLVDKGKMDEAKGILEDDFIPQVQNLSGIHITVEAADVLVRSAEYIASSL